MCADVRQITDAPHGHILAGKRVWSPDGQWLVYDVRRVGRVFDGRRIERVHVESGRVELVYQAANGAGCAGATWHPSEAKVIFLHGPEHASDTWPYAFWHRRGVVVDVEGSRRAETLDARDITAPYTPGALRGGTHVHAFSGDGTLVSSTYEDHVLQQLGAEGLHDLNQRNIAVSLCGRPVAVKKDHPRNHDGTAFSVVVSRTVNRPRPGSDEISRAFSDAWVGTNGYVRADGTRQKKAIAFQGRVRTTSGEDIVEVFIVDLPGDLTAAGNRPLAGTPTTRPAPPRDTVQRRLTCTADRPYPGIQGPRHWLRSAPDGSRIGFLMKDAGGIVQIWSVSPNGGEPEPVTRNPQPVQSNFSWGPRGRRIAYVMDNSIFVTDLATGEAT
ncbi:MAG: DUF3748 domain-containing protein, partial [Lentisphaerae bacterium]|nr:DUF3748 domain-containing protein [Lentisphaerota bacterium]